MQQLTIRGFDLELEHHLRQVAKALNLSLNKAALYLMRKGAGLDAAPQPEVVGDSVDHLIGTWSTAEVEEFRVATQGFERVEEENW